MIGRLVHTSDFRRLLAVAPRCRSAHFALHHVAGMPGASAGAPAKPTPKELSTTREPMPAVSVDKSCAEHHWLGLVVPKKQARRAVARNLIKRQAREAMRRHAAALPAGLWLVRLRQGFEASRFVSAASTALRGAVRAELDGLFERALTRQ